MRDKDGWGDGAPIKTNSNQRAGGHDGSAAADGDTVGNEEDETGDDNKPPEQQQVKVREKKTNTAPAVMVLATRETPSVMASLQDVDYLNE